jgi:hypothetical protein
VVDSAVNSSREYVLDAILWGHGHRPLQFGVEMFGRVERLWMLVVAVSECHSELNHFEGLVDEFECWWWRDMMSENVKKQNAGLLLRFCLI